MIAKLVDRILTFIETRPFVVAAGVVFVFACILGEHVVDIARDILELFAGRGD